MTPKQDTEAGSLNYKSVVVETLESRMCLSAAAAAGMTVAPMMMRYAVRAETRQIADRVEYHAGQAFAFHAATTEGFRGGAEYDKYHDPDGRPDVGGSNFHREGLATPVGGFVATFGGVMVKMFLIRLDSDAQRPATPPSLGDQAGDVGGGPTINPAYNGNPVSEPSSPPSGEQPVIAKPTDTTVQQPSDQTVPGSVQQPPQQGRPAKASVETRATATTSTTTTIQAALAIDSHALRSLTASTSRLAAAVLSPEGQAAADGAFTPRFASALKSLTPVNFADLSVARLAGAGESTFLHSFAAVPTQAAAAKVEGVLADAVVGATHAVSPSFFEFKHLGSPFALLSDSMANFIEDSASLPMAAAKGQRSAPWTLTATVVAADVVLLTYMYRRGQRNRRRYQYAHAYGYQPFAG